MPRKLLVIVGSTRPVRLGRAFGDWMVDFARENSDFEVSMADLAEINLPFMNEEKHPKLGEYELPHTLAWAKIVADADAFILVTPEYNQSFTAPLKNALDYLKAEWRDKPVAFLSYGGGIAGGTRAVTGLKPVVTNLKMIPVGATIAVPFASKYVSDQVAELPDELTKNGTAMLSELQRYADLLRPLPQN